jgi:hypothetical protein
VQSDAADDPDSGGPLRAELAGVEQALTAAQIRIGGALQVAETQASVNGAHA